MLDKYNDIKRIIDKVLNDYCISGQGECGLKKIKDCIIDDNSDDNSFSSFENDLDNRKVRKKGVSKEESLKVYSSQFFSFVKHNPISFYFYIAFAKYEIL